MRSFRVVLSLKTAMPEPELEAWVLELLEEAKHHLLDGESVELATIEKA